MKSENYKTGDQEDGFQSLKEAILGEMKDKAASTMSIQLIELITFKYGIGLK